MKHNAQTFLLQLLQQLISVSNRINLHQAQMFLIPPSQQLISMRNQINLHQAQLLLHNAVVAFVNFSNLGTTPSHGYIYLTIAFTVFSVSNARTSICLRLTAMKIRLLPHQDFLTGKNVWEQMES